METDLAFSNQKTNYDLQVVVVHAMQIVRLIIYVTYYAVVADFYASSMDARTTPEVDYNRHLAASAGLITRRCRGERGILA